MPLSPSVQLEHYPVCCASVDDDEQSPVHVHSQVCFRSTGRSAWQGSDRRRAHLCGIRWAPRQVSHVLAVTAYVTTSCIYGVGPQSLKDSKGHHVNGAGIQSHT
jgi:hypothetical protein